MQPQLGGKERDGAGIHMGPDTNSLRGEWHIPGVPNKTELQVLSEELQPLV